MTDIIVTRDTSGDTYDIYYTESTTPSVGDAIYDENRDDTGKTISAVGSGYIEFSDARTITFNWAGRTDRGYGRIKINNIPFDEGYANSITIPIGTQVEILGESQYADYTRESSNTNYIPNDICIHKYIVAQPLTFIMPDEDLSFTVFISSDPI